MPDLVLKHTNNDIWSGRTQKVYTSNTLGSWTLQDRLYCNRLSEVASPGIDTAILSYKYGRYADEEDPFEPLDLGRKYVKIEIIEDPDVIKTWYGIVEVDERQSFGLNIGNDSEFAESGNQIFTAHGLIYELDRTIISMSLVDRGDGTTAEIERGIGFNVNNSDRFKNRGNRTLDGSDNVFSFDVATDDKWIGWHAIEYLLDNHVPEDSQSVQTAQWQLTGDFASLGWYDITIPTDGRSVKSVIDEIVDRRRLVGYRVDVTEPGGIVTVSLHIFTLTHTPISLPDDATISPNDNQIDLDIRATVDIENESLQIDSTHVVDKVVARGAYLTSVFNVWVKEAADPKLLQPGWSSAQETAYKDGASNAAEYVGLTSEEKLERNQMVRQRDDLQDVYSRFVMSPEWTGVVPESMDTPANYYTVAVRADLLDQINPADLTPVFSSGTGYPNGGYRAELWSGGKRFLRFLPIKITSAGNEDEYREPFILFKTTDAGAGNEADDVWQYGHALSSNSPHTGSESRNFSVRLQVLQNALGVRLRSGGAGTQQMIASSDFVVAASTPDYHDPTNEGLHAVDFREAIVCVAMETDERVSFEYFPSQVDSGTHERTLYIDVPDARYDVIIPSTVTEIDDAGHVVRSTNGEVIRDDRERLEQIAEAAGRWYTTPRKVLKLTLKELIPATAGGGPPAADLEIGMMINNLTGIDKGDDINTVISSLDFDFVHQTTTIETAYADFQVI